MADPPSEWLTTALTLTGHFEDSGEPLTAVTGDFDQMGISLGVLQWNIGSGSLQPMIKTIGEQAVLQTMPTYGADLWRACTADKNTGLAICRAWQRNAKLNPTAFAELKSLTRSAAFSSEQLKRAGGVARAAYSDTQTFAAQSPAFGSATKPLFCWFFDLHTQNGGLKSLAPGAADQLIANKGKELALNETCDWLEGRTHTIAGDGDGVRNARLWRTTAIDDRHLLLLVLSYLRCQLSRAPYQIDTLNRKGTIAVWRGWVHQDLHDFTTLFS